jgi:hypothetical protein
MFTALMMEALGLRIIFVLAAVRTWSPESCLLALTERYGGGGGQRRKLYKKYSYSPYL